MAEDQKPAEPKKQSTEASATDLLSLWGGAPSAPLPSVPLPSAPSPVPPKPSSPPLHKPELPLPPPRQSEPLRHEPPPKHEHKPPPRPEPKPEPKIEKPEHPRPSERKKEEALEGEIVSLKTQVAPEPEFLEEREGFGSQFDEFLQELNLSRKHIFYGIGCLILLIVLIFGGISGFRYYKNRKTQQAPPPPTTEVSAPETGIPETVELGKVVPISAQSIGETGLATVISLGMGETSLTRIANYIMIFRRLQNAYASDINELLDKATDRRARLRSHLALLRKFLEEGNENLKNIKAELEIIKASYEPEKTKQEETDVNFFEQLTALNPQTAEEILEEFIDASQKVVAFRARFKALQKIEAFYEEALPKLTNRIRDIELNEEALVSGIKVYDVKGSDLQLILPVTGETVKEEEKLSSGVIPFIPTHPSKVKTEKDYITQPGGGF
jgi:hypothetical protein